MSVWFCIPSKRPRPEAQACIDRWREMGYLVAIRRDIGDETVDCDLLQYGTYEGYAKAVNGLIADVMKFDTDAQWFVTGGDDTDPDPKKRAYVIAAECEEYFSNGYFKCPSETLQGMPLEVFKTFGVMQPTGDRYAGGSIDRIAGSPWIGREFAERAYGGNGPYWPEYKHMFVDEEIREVAMRLGVYWMRPDLIHLHRHIYRESLDINARAVPKPVPDFLREANSPAHWQKYQAMYLERKAAGFPGHEVLSEMFA